MRKTLIFIAGAEGSGTTVLQRLLAAPSCCATAGYQFLYLPDDPDAPPLFDAVVKATARMWDRAAPQTVYAAAKRAFLDALVAIDESPAFSETSHIILKESFPFEFPHGRRIPDLWDVLDANEDARIITIYRDPRAAVYSALRRGFDDDLRRLATSCSESLTLLAGQVAAVGVGRVRLVSYERLCKAPEAVLAELARFCAIPSDATRNPSRAERVFDDADNRYATELSPTDVAWLEEYFNEGRRRQWEALARA